MHQFDATLIEAMEEPELEAHFCSLQEEALEKLQGSWRGKSAAALSKLLADKTTSHLEASRELHANLAMSAQNLHFKLALFTDESLKTLAWVISTLLVMVALASAAVLLFSTHVPEYLGPWAQALLLGMVAGALGGAVSMAFSLGRTDLKKKIPDIRLTSLVTATRPLLGAMVSIPVVIFVNIGFISILNLDKLLLVLPACFLGGFSERWFLGLMERAEKLK